MRGSFSVLRKRRRVDGGDYWGRFDFDFNSIEAKLTIWRAAFTPNVMRIIDTKRASSSAIEREGSPAPAPRRPPYHVPAGGPESLRGGVVLIFLRVFAVRATRRSSTRRDARLPP